MEDRYAILAKQFCDSIKTLAEKTDNLFNFECYLSHHFSDWMGKYASTPEDLVSEMKSFAEMKI